MRRVGGSRVCDIAGESRASYGTVAASVMRTVESLISSPGRWRERALGELINLSDVRGLRRAYTSGLSSTKNLNGTKLRRLDSRELYYFYCPRQ